eukprot:9274004-Ditylum_brightwellii.AAC.1
MALTQAEYGYQANMCMIAMMEFAAEDYKIDFEVAGVGVGVEGGFVNTHGLRAMKLDEAMHTDKDGWTKAVEEEHQRMIKNKVWMPVKLSKVTKGSKVLTSTWACKLKSKGKKRACINGRGYEQVDGVHYDGTSIHAPVTNEVSMPIIMKEKIYMRVPQGFEKYYPANVVLLLFKTIYATKQAAMVFWKKLLKFMMDIKHECNGADSCLYFKWTLVGL